VKPIKYEDNETKWVQQRNKRLRADADKYSNNNLIFKYMKVINLVEKALVITNEPEIKTLLSEFLRANTIAQNEKFDLSKYVSNPKYDHHETLTGIFHENGFRIATNGRILCAVDHDYPDEFEGKTVSPKGQIIEGRFPVWQNVLPKVDDLTGLIFTKNAENILQKIKEEQAVAKAENADVFVKITREGQTVCFDAKMFVLFLNFIKTYRRTNVGIRYYGSQSNIFAKDQNGNLCLLMSREVDDTSEHFVDLSYVKINMN
jgi:hypothetical protein